MKILLKSVAKQDLLGFEDLENAVVEATFFCKWCHNHQLNMQKINQIWNLFCSSMIVNVFSGIYTVN